MSKEKMRWIRPQLIVLGRGTPEERVLAPCKTKTLDTGAFGTNLGCYEVLAPGCNPCNGVGGS